MGRVKETSMFCNADDVADNFIPLVWIGSDFDEDDAGQHAQENMRDADDGTRRMILWRKLSTSLIMVRHGEDGREEGSACGHRARPPYLPTTFDQPSQAKLREGCRIL